MLNVVKLHKDAIIPEKAHDGDAGFDLFALEDTIILPNDTKVIQTGIGIEIPYGYYGDVTGKSGLTSKTQLRVQRGIVDFGYQGDIGVIVSNQQSYKWDDNIFDMLIQARYDVNNAKELSDLFVTKILENEESGVIKIKKGQKIAQIVISPCEPSTQVMVHSSFSDISNRGDGGFGSSGLYVIEGSKSSSRVNERLTLNSAIGQTGKIHTGEIYGVPNPPESVARRVEEYKALAGNGFIGG